MSENSKKTCACTQGLVDLLRASSTKKDLLRKVTCSKCGKVYWTNTDDDICFDCKEKVG